MMLDLTDLGLTEAYFHAHHPTHVIHLAADVGGLYKNMNQGLDMFENNLAINLNIVKTCRKFGVINFITLLSTCVFPDKTSYPLNADHINRGEPHSSNEGYSYAKRMLERHVNYVRETTGWRWKSFIPVNIFGRYDNFSLKDAHVIPALIHKAYLASKNSGAPMTVNGDGSALRQFISASKVARILHDDLVGATDIANNSILCGTKEMSIKHIVYMIAAYYGVFATTFDDSFPSGQHRKTASKTYDIDFSKELKDTMNWFSENYLNARGV